MPRYDWTIDLQDVNNTLTYQFHMVPAGALVLDVGCATGFLSKALVAKGCQVIGVEPDPEGAAGARALGLDVLELDITAPDAARRLLEHTGGRRFDVVVYGDVLEHLVDPWRALKATRDLLDPAGKVVASIPNVAHGSIRLDLLRGRFSYTTTGLLDSTHVQLFTRERVLALFADCGFDIDTLDRSYFPIFGTEGRIRPGDLPDDVVAYVAGDRESWVYQYIVDARPRPARETLSEAAMAAEGRAAGCWQPDVARAEVHIVSVGEALGPDQRMAYRLAVPASHRLRFATANSLAEVPEVVEAAGEDVVLAVTADLLPEPNWVQTLMRGASSAAGAIGVGVVDTRSTLVHAGCSADGRPFGRGAGWAAAPMFAADRARAFLTLPVAVSAASLPSLRRTRPEGPLPGRYLGAAPAVALRPAPAAEDAACGEVFGDTVLFVGALPPSRLSPQDHQALLHAVEEVAQRGHTPVLWWSDEGLWSSRASQRAFERAGAVLFGGEAADLPHEAFAPQLRPPLAAVGEVFAPKIVVLMPDWEDHDGTAVLATTSPDATVISWGRQAARADALVTSPAVEPQVLARELRVALRPESSPSRPTPRIPDVRVAERVPGLTSIVVPVWNNWTLTAACLDAIAARTPEPHEVVVVDNASSDETPRALKARARSDNRLRVVTNASNLGFAGGVNAGLCATRGEHVVILNNDTEPTDGWLAELLAVAQRPEVGLVGARGTGIAGVQCINDAPAINPSTIGAAHAWAADWGRGRAGTDWPARRLIGFCLAARAEVLEKVGGFDERFGFGNFEDDDLCARVSAAGYELRVADGAVVLHHGSATFQRLAEAGFADFQDLLRRNGRLFDARTLPTPLVGLVLSDGQSSAATDSAASLAAVVDRVVVAERADLASTQLCASAVAEFVTVEVVGFDWTGEAAAEFVATLGAQQMIVVAAGEELRVGDHGRARAALHRAAATGPVALRGPGGTELRICRPTVDALGVIGTPAPSPLVEACIVPAGQASA